MLLFIFRRVGWSVLTILGVMIITFVLFRWAVAGDVVDAVVGPKAPEKQKTLWREQHGYNKPLMVNLDQFPANVLDSQFLNHLWNTIRFEGRSFRDNKTLGEIIRQRAPYSLSITVPAMAIGFLVGLVISCFVAYYRGRLADRVGVLMCVLWMCVPVLAWLVYGQWIMSGISPLHSFGLWYKTNIYLPVGILVLAGLGGSVRFYRTIILDETGRDYVRTARAKGLSLPSILFKHVLRNCMLPILTNLIMAIPFLIMGSLLVETYFGIPGLGDLMLSSIMERNEPIMNGLVFLTALIYTVGVLLTDLSYALFDPRIRLG